MLYEDIAYDVIPALRDIEIIHGLSFPHFACLVSVFVVKVPKFHILLLSLPSDLFYYRCAFFTHRPFPLLVEPQLAVLYLRRGIA